VKIGMRIPGQMGRQGLEWVARWAVNHGLGFLDLGDIDEKSAKTIQDAGLFVGTLDCMTSALLSKDAAKQQQGLETWTARMDKAKQHGVGIIFTCLIPADATLSRGENFAIWRDVFPEVVRRAEERGVRIAVEGWPGGWPWYANVGCTPEQWRAMFAHISSPALGLNYDPSHLVRLGIDYQRALVEFAERVIHTHGKDTELLPEGLYESGVIGRTFGSDYFCGEAHWRYTVPGQGIVNWSAVLSRLEKVGYQGHISIELEDARYTGSAEREGEGILASQRALCQYL
jgi:sugar phosphate isomerase/epimerase